MIEIHLIIQWHFIKKIIPLKCWILSSIFKFFRSLMPTKIQQWFNLVIPFHDLAPTFEEFSLIKALTVWHMSTLIFLKILVVLFSSIRLFQTERCKPPDLPTTEKCDSECNPRAVRVE